MNKKLNVCFCTLLVCFLAINSALAIENPCLMPVKDKSNKLTAYKVIAGVSCPMQVNLGGTAKNIEGKCTTDGQCVAPVLEINDCLKIVNPTFSKGIIEINAEVKCPFIHVNEKGEKVTLDGMCNKYTGSCIPDSPCITFDGKDTFKINKGLSCKSFTEGFVKDGVCTEEGECK